MPDLIRVAIFGSTGSIGVQTLDVIRQHPDKFKVTILTAYDNAGLLIRQAEEFKPDFVVIGKEEKYNQVKEALFVTETAVIAGLLAFEEAAEMDIYDIMIAAIVGYAGLKPTLKAVELGKKIGLANKETLVVAGELITRTARISGAVILPVDSEHSAIFQCLEGEQLNKVEKLILTASGGPFRGKKTGDLEKISVSDALRHPNWSMGAKVTIDSASLMNKGLEMIEAKWLFDVLPDQIEAVIHPQSIIHSMVQFEDGCIKAQMGIPDMRLPIQYALSYPQRITGYSPRFDFENSCDLSFEKIDGETFRNFSLAKVALYRGGNIPCILNAANEIAVNAFLNQEVGFLQMSDIIESTISRLPFIEVLSLDDYIACDVEARQVASSLIKKSPALSL
ncbi:1-deoxy-D-xylulose-5-phosphate reductoisomerase [Pedobacter cryoconitis]|uniref:1-deoxy-D-xylulose 5-phosphate reductoisomerase n=1 Tax=Pedobacter cryoconitis TaxID=188932 RepID=A0A7X0J521_9SPHI|nr:1-deoxy-D-xylulose-5-phosphate reductoisomerase [Pedobacter cryoconitis]MBB6501253.1 1-deoxy-D-xylulose-5-phosphate reductoisomerase [Pedobacter cryoconitis]